MVIKKLCLACAGNENVSIVTLITALHNPCWLHAERNRLIDNNCKKYKKVRRICMLKLGLNRSIRLTCQARNPFWLVEVKLGSEINE